MKAVLVNNLFVFRSAVDLHVLYRSDLDYHSSEQLQHSIHHHNLYIFPSAFRFLSKE